MLAAWRRLREARALRRHAIPDALWQRTLARYDFLARRDADDAEQLRRLIPAQMQMGQIVHSCVGAAAG